VRARRERWPAEPPAWGPTPRVFLDETWATPAMARRDGRCPEGQRLVCPVPQGHRQTTAFVAAWRRDGRTAPGGATGR